MNIIYFWIIGENQRPFDEKIIVCGAYKDEAPLISDVSIEITIDFHIVIWLEFLGGVKLGTL